MSLEEYRKKRNLQISPEPSGTSRVAAARTGPLLYVIQKHRATQLHYDFRLEYDGVLLSWAVPKGPSLDPSVKRLAMQVEDHPREYASFEGVIPADQYGAGTVMVWDQGEWSPESDDVESSLRKGDLKFTLHGKRLRGSWVLVRTRGYGSKAGKSWLLIKHRDRYASNRDIAVAEPHSVLSRRLLADIAREEGGDVEMASTGDPTTGVRSGSQEASQKLKRKKRGES
jgi:bifunctional non-homologous end joining protein LigD